MELPPLVIQTAGSLVAIIALAGLAWWLKLGGSPTLTTSDDVRRAAGEVADGFAPVAESRDAAGRSALARDGAGRIMVIKRHGNRFAGRILGPDAAANLWRDQGTTALEVDCGEARFGKVFLDLPDAQTWAEAINRVNGPRDG
jgi:hypothetical protein